MEEKNVYQKLQHCRCELQEKKIKKSGENKFAGFNYYELGDFIPTVNDLFRDYGLTSNFSIDTEKQEAVLRIINSDKPSEQISFTSPIADANIKGCTPVQSLGGVHTYLKRYLYLNALEIVESDILDSKAGTIEVDTPTTKKATPKQIEILLKTYQGVNLTKLLEANQIKKIEDLSLTKASELISKIKGGK